MTDNPALTIPRETPPVGEVEPGATEPVTPSPRAEKLPKIDDSREQIDDDVPYFGF